VADALKQIGKNAEMHFMERNLLYEKCSN